MWFSRDLTQPACDASVHFYVVNHPDVGTGHLGIDPVLFLHAAGPVRNAVLSRVDGVLRHIDPARLHHVFHESAQAVAGTAGRMQIPADERTACEFELIPDPHDRRVRLDHRAKGGPERDHPVDPVRVLLRNTLGQHAAQAVANEAYPLTVFALNSEDLGRKFSCRVIRAVVVPDDV